MSLVQNPPQSSEYGLRSIRSVLSCGLAQITDLCEYAMQARATLKQILEKLVGSMASGSSSSDFVGKKEV